MGHLTTAQEGRQSTPFKGLLSVPHKSCRNSWVADSSLLPSTQLFWTSLCSLKELLMKDWFMSKLPSLILSWFSSWFSHEPQTAFFQFMPIPSIDIAGASCICLHDYTHWILGNSNKYILPLSVPPSFAHLPPPIINLCHSLIFVILQHCRIFLNWTTATFS